jgi:hypothetical protein
MKTAPNCLAAGNFQIAEWWLKTVANQFMEFHHDGINQTPPDMSLSSLYLDRNSVALISSDHLMILLITLAKIKHADSFVFKNKK